MVLFTVARCNACLFGSVLAYRAMVLNMSARVDSWPLMLPVWVVVVSILCVFPLVGVQLWNRLNGLGFGV